MAGLLSITTDLAGSFAEVGVFMQAEVDVIIQESGERVRQGAADRSRVKTGDMRDGWTFTFEGDQAGSVYNDVPYTIDNEFGTVHMTAQPMLYPAIDAERQTFEAELRQVVGS